MISQKVRIQNKGGMHLRPAGLLCKEALAFESLITIHIRHSIANAKSVLSVLAAGIKYHDELEVVCEGEDEQEALHYLVKLIEDGLGEAIEDEENMD